MENKTTHSAKNVKTSKRRARNAKIVKRRIAMLIAALVVIAAIIIAVVCKVVGVFDSTADESMITIMDDGKIVCEEVTDFSEKDYIKQQIKEYTAENGANSVKLDKLKIKGDVAYAKITYASADDYSKFTSLGLYTGTVKQAAKKGFDFADAFVSVKDGVKGTSVESLDITSQKKLKVAVIKENIRVAVDGEILYVSDACTTMVDKNTVAIAQPDGNEDATQLTYIIYK
mgnify:CR=1 FL=1